MNKNRKHNFFKELNTSDELRKNVLDKTINLENFDCNDKRKLKLSYVSLIIIFMAVTSCSMVWAIQYIQYINFKENINENGREQVIVLNNPVNINDLKNFNCQKGDKLESIGNILGINFYSELKYNTTIDICSVNISYDNKVESVSISISDYIDYSEVNNKIDGYDSDFENNASAWFKGKHISLDIAFITPNASNETLDEFSNLWAVSSDWGTGMEVNEVLIEEIGVMAYYYSPIRPGVNSMFNYVVFEHNNIGYLFQGYNVSVEEILKIIS